jgi:Trp operon repressor
MTAFMSKFTELEKKKDEEEVILTILRHQVLEKEQRVNQMLEELTAMVVEGATMLKTLPPHLRAFVEGDSSSPTTLDADDADDTKR